MPFFRRQCALAAFLTASPVVFSAMAYAQSTATLQGTVTDASGAVLAGARITIHSIGTGQDREVEADSAGSYAVPSLQPGAYSVQAQAQGFSITRIDHILLMVDQRTTVNLKLSVASAGETVEVAGTAPIIDADTITVGQVIDQRTVQNIPLNGRHFLDLTALVPGSVTPPTSGSLTSPSRGLGANSFITAGNREDSANFMINGINLNDLSQNQITFQPSIDTTAEFKISNSTPSAEYGRSSGAIVNVATRSGTNEFHGEVFDYLRNNDLDARNYFNPHGTRMNEFQRNNFGASVGGPVLRDRTFFFLSFEGLRQSQQLNLTSGVLTTAQRAAFAASPAGPQWAQLVGLIPQANSGAASFTGSAAGPVKVSQYTGDVLHKISTADQLHLYYAFQQDNRTEPNLQGNTLPGFGDHRDSHRQIGTINETHIFNSNVVNEARLGFSRIAIAFSPEAVINPASYGIGSGAVPGSTIPQISVPSIGLNIGGPGGFPQGRYDTTGVASDTLNYLWGKHTIKAGGEYRRVVGDSFGGDPGSLSFSSVQSFINGTVNSFAITPQRVVSRLFTNAAAAFVDDTYKVSPRVEVELGLRFEWNGTPTEGADRLINFLASNDSLTNIHTHGYNNAYNQNYNYEPRVGFTWDVRGNAQTILRGAYGILADQPTLNAVSGLAGNPPLAAPVNYSGGAGAVGSIYAEGGASGLAPTAVNPQLTNAYMESYNLNLQQQVGSATALQIGYIGSLGRHLRIRRNLNQPTLAGNARPFLTLAASSPIDPGSRIGNISEVDSNAYSDYSALWFTMRQNLSHGLEFDSTYTWSRSMDVNSLGSQGGYTLQDNFNPQGNYAPSDFDARNRFVFSGIWQLPLHGGRLKDGWQIANITQLQSGNPFTVLTTSTYNGTSGTMRPDQLGSYRLTRTKLASNNLQYLAASGCNANAATLAGCSFFAPSTGFGTLGRNSIVGPGLADSDISVQKNTKLAEATSIELRADAFDFLNHANFNQPNATISTSGTQPTTAGTLFGQINQTRFPVGDLGSSRQLQFSLKFFFYQRRIERGRAASPQPSCAETELYLSRLNLRVPCSARLLVFEVGQPDHGRFHDRVYLEYLCGRSVAKAEEPGDGPGRRSEGHVHFAMSLE